MLITLNCIILNAFLVGPEITITRGRGKEIINKNNFTSAAVIMGDGAKWKSYVIEIIT